MLSVSSEVVVDRVVTTGADGVGSDRAGAGVNTAAHLATLSFVSVNGRPYAFGLVSVGEVAVEVAVGEAEVEVELEVEVGEVAVEVAVGEVAVVEAGVVVEPAVGGAALVEGVPAEWPQPATTGRRSTAESAARSTRRGDCALGFSNTTALRVACDSDGGGATVVFPGARTRQPVFCDGRWE